MTAVRLSLAVYYLLSKFAQYRRVRGANNIVNLGYLVDFICTRKQWM